MILRARVILPVAAPLIHDGAIIISGKRISRVGRWRDLRSQDPEKKPLDLGEVIVLPGLVNAHCHLDYTHMAGQFPPPKVFTDWLKLITTTKAGWSLSEYSASWGAGAQMLVRTGTTTVGDIEAVPQLLPEMWQATPLRVVSFLEMIGITARRPPRTLLQESLGTGLGLRNRRCRIGLSPHAPYSTVPELLQLTARAAARHRWPVCIHLAESALEFDMFAHGKGEMHDWLKRSGRDMTDCGLGSPTQHLERCGVLRHNLLAAHVNYLGKHDASLLARRHVNVVHCPRSHSYFRHAPFPLRKLRREGANVCLGTDSLASVYRSRNQVVELNMFEEMRLLAQREPSVSPRKILQMSTVCGARALGLSGLAGELSPDAFADLILLPLRASEKNLYEQVLDHRGEVAGSMIDGRWAINPAYIPRA